MMSVTTQPKIKCFIQNLVYSFQLKREILIHFRGRVKMHVYQKTYNFQAIIAYLFDAKVKKRIKIKISTTLPRQRFFAFCFLCTGQQQWYETDRKYKFVFFLKKDKIVNCDKDHKVNWNCYNYINYSCQ